MPYIVRQSQPNPWFSATAGALGDLADIAIMDRRRQAAEAAQLAQEQRANARADQVYTRTRADQTADMKAQQKFTVGRDTARQAFDTTQAGTRRANELADTQSKQAIAAAEAQRLQRELGIGQPTPEVPIVAGGGANPITARIPATPGVQFQTPGAVETAARIKMARENAQAMAGERQTDNARADERLALDRQRLEQTAQKLAAAAKRKDLTPEQSREVQAAIQVINDRAATPADYAAAFMVARKYDYAPVGAAIQKREDPKDSAEAKVLQGKIQRASAEMLSLVRKTGKTTADRTRIQQLDAEIAAMETQFQSKYGSGGEQTSPADLTDDELDRELTGR